MNYDDFLTNLVLEIADHYFERTDIDTKGAYVDVIEASNIAEMSAGGELDERVAVRAMLESGGIIRYTHPL